MHSLTKQESIPNTPALAVVAGHICLDIIPSFASQAINQGPLFVPGKLSTIGPVVVSTGGAVPNTGLALHKLGIPTDLIARVGSDLFGKAILDSLASHDPALTRCIQVAQSNTTSYTIVINPPKSDRMFLHFPGENDTFTAATVTHETVSHADLFHFGYPPLMQGMYANNGQELVALFTQVKKWGLLTSLDMSLPDPESAAGQVDWSGILKRVLPEVDIFLPSIDEIRFMLRGVQPDSLLTIQELRALADELLAMGCAIVGLKLGDKGLYVRSSDNPVRIARLQHPKLPLLDQWFKRELYSSCFDVTVEGTTGAGDCTIGGFLAALLRGLDPIQTVTTAVAVGACNVEMPDATSGIPDWQSVQSRIAGEWRRCALPFKLDNWKQDINGSWLGPQDSGV